MPPRLILALCVIQSAVLYSNALQGNVPVRLTRVPTQLHVRGKNKFTSTTGKTNDQESTKNVPRIAVKPRPLVSFDEKSGRYIPQSNTAVPPASSDSPREYYDEYSSMGGWNALKDGVYGIVDSVSGLRSKKSANDITARALAVAYSDTVGSEVSPSSTPGRRLLKAYDKSLKNDPETRNDISTGENLFTSDKRQSFNSVKDSLYDTVDDLSKRKENDTRGDKISIDVFRVATKPSFNKEESVALVSSQIDDLVSKNPLKRFKAQIAISTEQRKRQRNLQAKKKKQAFDTLKEMFYSFVETCQAIYLVVLSIPEEVEKVIEATQDTLGTVQNQFQNSVMEMQQTPAKIERAVEQTLATTTETIGAIREIPEKVESKFTETKEGINKTFQEVQAIPGKVDDTMTKTKKSIEDTNDRVANFVQTLEDVTFDAKVMVGLEQAKPPPPPPPPPPKTGRDIALDVVGEAAKLAGIGAVVVAKGTVGMGISGAKVAWNAAIKAKEDKVEQKGSFSKAEGAFTETINKSEKPRTIAEIDPLLEKEVAEALRVAEEALAAGKDQSVAALKSEGIPTMDINEAVMRAKEAAAQARRDAADLEAMLMERKYYIKE